MNFCKVALCKLKPGMIVEVAAESRLVHVQILELRFSSQEDSITLSFMDVGKPRSIKFAEASSQAILAFDPLGR